MRKEGEERERERREGEEREERGEREIREQKKKREMGEKRKKRVRPCTRESYPNTRGHPRFAEITGAVRERRDVELQRHHLRRAAAYRHSGGGPRAGRLAAAQADGRAGARSPRSSLTAAPWFSSLLAEWRLLSLAEPPPPSLPPSPRFAKATVLAECVMRMVFLRREITPRFRRDYPRLPEITRDYPRLHWRGREARLRELERHFFGALCEPRSASRRG
jgi:hypothetical protein